MNEAERIAVYYRERESQLPADRYAEESPAPLFIRRHVEQTMLEMLDEAGVFPLRERSFLDVGSGTGQWLTVLEAFGAEPERLAGLDLVESRIERARQRVPGADLRVGDAAELPWDDGAFDVVFQSMMFSSIRDREVRVAAAREIARVLAEDGVVVSYDFHVGNPRNGATRPLRRFELRSLFPGFDIQWRSTTLAPPLVRLLVPQMRGAAAALQRARLLNTHSMAVLRRRR